MLALVSSVILVSCLAGGDGLPYILVEYRMGEAQGPCQQGSNFYDAGHIVRGICALYMCWLLLSLPIWTKAGTTLLVSASRFNGSELIRIKEIDVCYGATSA